MKYIMEFCSATTIHYLYGKDHIPETFKTPPAKVTLLSTKREPTGLIPQARRNTKVIIRTLPQLRKPQTSFHKALS